MICLLHIFVRWFRYTIMVTRLLTVFTKTYSVPKRRICSKKMAMSLTWCCMYLSVTPQITAVFQIALSHNNMFMMSETKPKSPKIIISFISSKYYRMMWSLLNSICGLAGYHWICVLRNILIIYDIGALA